MATTLLITRSNFAGRVEIAANMQDAKINNRILEAQDFDLCGLMGSTFYWWFIGLSGGSTTPYTDLLNGKTYTINDVSYTFYGVAPVIVYYATSRLIKNLDLHLTPNAVMQKRNDFSDHIDPKDISWRSNQFVSQALDYWKMCEQFLDNNKDVYPLWRPDCCNEQGQTSSPRVRALGGLDADAHQFPFINRRF